MKYKRTTEDIKAIAFSFRKKLGFENIEYLDMRVVLERAKQLIRGFDWIQVRNHELPGAGGMYNPKTGVLEIPDRVLEALAKGVPRARFTVAHELAHAVLEHADIRFRHEHKKAHERAKADIARDEREAEEFAAFLLAPDHLCDGCQTFRDFVEKFGLSKRAAEIRKEDRDRDDRRSRREKRPLPPGVINYLQHAQSRGHTVTALDQQPKSNPTSPTPVPGTDDGSMMNPENCGSERGLAAAIQPIASHTRHTNAICPVCGWRTIASAGQKDWCDNCRTMSDKFQDGDSA